MRKKYKHLLAAVLGLISLIWFLIRVIPKPSRASYPCQRIAFPFASAFVIWILGTLSSLLIFRKAREQYRNSNHMVAVMLLTLALAGFGMTFLSVPSKATYGANKYAGEPPFEPVDGFNNPMGEGKGIFPGRVVWNWNPKATSWNGYSEYWWSSAYNRQDTIDSMLSQTLRQLTGAQSDEEAWEKIFIYHNNKIEGGNEGYKAGEKIAIKLNLNAITSATGSERRTKPTPQMVLALTRQLVLKAGVKPVDIIYYDAGRIVPNSIYDRIVKEFPGVQFKGKFTAEGRTEVEVDYSDDAVIHWSSDLKVNGVNEEDYTGEPSYFVKCITEATYMINLGILRAHHIAGVTFGTKNHFGSFRCHRSDGTLPNEVPKAAGIHTSAAVHDVINGSTSWSFEGRPMDVYNPLPILMGHKHTGGKTVLYLVDGFYATAEEVGNPVKFKMQPFNDDWTSCMFASQDPVAIESVCLDFLRTEQPEDGAEMYVRGSVDNYLHEAAMANDPPSGTVYDPENDGIPLSSLGAHEHWNDAVNMQYSRNLGFDSGIELVTIGYKVSGYNWIENFEKRQIVFPNPVTQQRFELTLEENTGISKVRMINLNGVIVHEQNVSGEPSVQVSGFDAAPGIYMLSIETTKGNRTEPILIL